MHDLSHPETAAEERSKNKPRFNPETASASSAALVQTAQIVPDVQSQGRQKIPGDVVYAATSHLPEVDKGAIRWFHKFAKDNDLTNGEAGALIHYSDAAVSLLFRGKYTADIKEIVTRIIAFRDTDQKKRDLADARAAVKKVPFIKTALTKKIWDLCNACRIFQRIGYIFSDSQIGKSENLWQYQIEHNHGNTIYISVPTQGTLIHFVEKLAEVLSIPMTRNSSYLRRRIINAFDHNMLLIVDEAHRCIPKGASAMSLQTIEFIREIHDEKKCGVVLCGTNAFRDEIEKGKYMKMLKQIRRRRLGFLQLPIDPTEADLNTFARAYGLAPATGKALELQKRIVADEALGMWLTIMRMGADLSAKRRRGAMSWDDVIQAESALCSLEGR
jgi:DNA transposition AAA+ family ATPase